MQRVNLSQYSNEVVHWASRKRPLKCALGLDPRSNLSLQENWTFGKIGSLVEFEPRSNCSLGSECFHSSKFILGSGFILGSDFILGWIGAYVKLDSRSNWTLGSECIFGSDFYGFSFSSSARTCSKNKVSGPNRES